MGLTRNERTQLNKELIISKSIELFREKGYEATTMADIAKATGLSNGSIYHLYPNKHKIIQAIFDLYFGPELGLNNNIEEHIHDPIPHIKDYLQKYEQIWVQIGWFLPSCIYYLVEEDNSGQAFPIDSYPTTFRQEMNDFIKASQNAGVIRTDYNAETLSNSLFLFGRGCLYQWSISHGSFDLTEMTRPYWDMVLPALLA